MKSFTEYLIAELKQSQPIDENRRSMGRLVQHFKNDPFVIVISVERNPRESVTSEDIDTRIKQFKQAQLANIDNTMMFRDGLRHFQHTGYITVNGSYVEQSYDTYGKPVDVLVKERSSIVYCTDSNKDDVFQYCKRWALKTNQQCIPIVKHGKASFYYPSDNRFENVGLFYPDKIGDYYTTLYGKTNKPVKSFTFTSDRSKISKAVAKMFNYTDTDYQQYTKSKTNE